MYWTPIKLVVSDVRALGVDCIIVEPGNKRKKV